MKKSLKYIILTIFIVMALVITFYKNLDYNHEMSGDEVDLYGYNTQAVGYDMSQAENGIKYTVNAADPQLIFTLDKTCVGGIRLLFGETWTGEESLPVQVFYARNGESYAEKHSAKGELKTGENELLLPVPLAEYHTLRLDIDGNFILNKISGCTQQMKSTSYISDETINTCMWYFPTIIIGFCLILWAHETRMKQGSYTAKSYVKSIFLGAEPSNEREVYLDYLRILAAVFVILAHACSPMVDLADTDWKRLVLVCGLSLGLCCNLLYVMLSGTLLLSAKKEESVASFYIRRASKVIIPLIAYYLLLLSLNDEVGFLPPKNIGAAFKRIVTGAPDVGPHLWLIYTIVALYLVTPFFKVMVQNLNDRLIFSLAIVILVLNMLTTYLPLFGMTFGAATFLAGWEGVFLLGYIMTRQNNVKNLYMEDFSHDKICADAQTCGVSVKCRNNVIMIMAVISYIITVAVVFTDSSNMNYVYNSAPTMVIISCGIFALFLENKERFKGKSNFVVRICSKYSYSIILIHWYALFVVVQGKLHITALRFGCIGGIGVTVVLTFIVCLLMAIIFDNTVVIVCNVIFDKVIQKLNKKR